MFKHKMERSNSSHAILETASRKRKAEKIQAVIEEATDLSNAHVLDIGTGSGDIAHELSKHANKVSSVDIVDERKIKQGYTFMLAADETLPFEDETFDVVITNHVVEHTPDQDKHLSEVLRVLKPGGYVYLATPNKYWLTDPHYKLPFISWMPRTLSRRYLKAVQKANWDIYPLSPRGVKVRLPNVTVTNALPVLLTTRAAEKLDTWRFAVGVSRFTPKQVLDFSQYVSPTLIYLIHKPNS